jgi:hypothetical protein
VNRKLENGGAFYLPHAARAAGLSAFVWSALHVALAVGGVLRLDGRAASVVVFACMTVVHLDLRRHSTHLFYANLGIAPAQGALVALLAAVILEIILRVAVRIAGIP